MKDFAIEFSEEFSEPALIRKNVITEEPAAKIQTESNEHQIGNR